MRLCQNAGTIRKEYQHFLADTLHAGELLFGTRLFSDAYAFILLCYINEELQAASPEIGISQSLFKLCYTLI